MREFCKKEDLGEKTFEDIFFFSFFIIQSIYIYLEELINCIRRDFGRFIRFLQI
jgi:hypothetical protein